MNGTVFGTLNTSIIIIYLLSMLFIGWLFSRNNQEEEQFFLGSRKVPWLAVAMSMYASLTSAITYIGLPAIAYQENIALIGVPDCKYCCNSIYIKIFLSYLSSTTSYDILSIYQKKIWTNGTKKCGSTFCTYSLRWFKCRFAMPSLALSTATGFSLTTCILLMGLVATIYTTFGGLTAVIWTDVIQFIILIGGAIWISITLIHQVDGGFVNILDSAYDAEKINIFEWPPSLFLHFLCQL